MEMASPYSLSHSSLPTTPILEPLTTHTPLTLHDNYSPIVELFMSWNSQQASPALTDGPKPKRQQAANNYPKTRIHVVPSPSLAARRKVLGYLRPLQNNAVADERSIYGMNTSDSDSEATVVEDRNSPPMGKKSTKRIRLSFGNDCADVTGRPVQPAALDINNEAKGDSSLAPSTTKPFPKCARLSHSRRPNINGNQGGDDNEQILSTNPQLSKKPVKLELCFGRNNVIGATTTTPAVSYGLSTLPGTPGEPVVTGTLPTFLKPHPVYIEVKVRPDYDELSDQEESTYLREQEAMRKRKARQKAYRQDMIYAIAESPLMEKIANAEFECVEEVSNQKVESEQSIRWEGVD